MSALTAIIGSVYRHVEKTAVPTGVTRNLKWYDLREEHREIPRVAVDGDLELAGLVETEIDGRALAFAHFLPFAARRFFGTG